MDLPVRGDDLKVCAYKNQLFLLSVPCAQAYIFNPSTRTFTKIDLCNEIHLLMMEDFSLFAYKEEIYLKGKHLLKTKIEISNLTIVESNTLIPYIPSEHSFSILSDYYLYTFYIQDSFENREDVLQFYTLEKFNMETLESTLIIDHHDSRTPLTVEQQTYYLRENPNLFLLQHYGLVEEDEFVTDYFLNTIKSL